MSNFEILTITYSFIVGLGVAQVLRSIGYMVRESGQVKLHWIPFSIATQILFFQVQFWFGLSVVNSMMTQWSWGAYVSMLLLAILIFLSGATVLPHSLSSIGGQGLREDFETRGRVSLIFLALYLLGWIWIGIMLRVPQLWYLALVNGLYAAVAIAIYATPGSRVRTVLHLVMIALTVYGAFTVWTTPSLEVPWHSTLGTSSSS